MNVVPPRTDDVTTFAVAGLLDPLSQRTGDLKKVALSLLGEDISRRMYIGGMIGIHAFDSSCTDFLYI